MCWQSICSKIKKLFRTKKKKKLFSIEEREGIKHLEGGAKLGSSIAALTPSIKHLEVGFNFAWTYFNAIFYRSILAPN